MTNDIELIKQKLDIVEFINSYIPLQPAGKNFKALCPFHQEKTPSFIVSPERQIWHCFGCGKGGDVIKFLMLYENLEFSEALQVLAEKVGVEIRKINPQQQKEIGILYDINEQAKEFFVQQLKKNREAFDYLKSRGLKANTIEEFELGFAPGGETLTLYLLNLGYDIADIVRAGLSFKNVKGFYQDRFENRIIFPIANNMGKTVAFTGRILPTVEGAENLAKYLNSPETLIFNKSKVLYAFHKSKPEITKTRSVFLVEGQFDALLAWQVGIKQVVAVSGSNLSYFHLQTLRRLADTIFLSFDKDEAGTRALERALAILNPFDFYVKVVDLGNFKDPAEAAQKNTSFLPKAIAHSEAALDYLFKIYLPPENNFELVQQKRILRKLLTIIKRLKSPIEQQAWVKKLAKHSGVSENALIEELNLIKLKEEPLFSNSEVISDKEIIKKERWELIAERVLMFAFYKDDFWSIVKTVRRYLPSNFHEFIDNPENFPDHLKLQATYELSNRSDEELKKELEELLIHLKIESLKKEREKVKQTIRFLQEKGDEVELDKISKVFSDLTTEIQHLTKNKKIIRI